MQNNLSLTSSHTNVKYYRSTEITVLKPGDHIFRPIDSHHGIVIEKTISLDIQVIDFYPLDNNKDTIEKNSIHDFLINCAFFGIVEYPNDNETRRKKLIETAKSHFDKGQLTLCDEDIFEKKEEEWNIYSEIIYGIYFPYYQVKNLIPTEYTDFSSDVCLFKTKTGCHIVGIKLNNITLQDIQSTIKFDIIDNQIYELCKKLNLELYSSKNSINMHYIDTYCDQDYNSSADVNIDGTLKYTNAIIIYGICYNFKKVDKILNKNMKYISIFLRVKETLEPDDYNKVFLWDENLYNINNVSYITSRNDNMTHNRDYFIGIDITDMTLNQLKELNLSEIQSEIKKAANMYSLPFNEDYIKLHYSTD